MKEAKALTDVAEEVGTERGKQFIKIWDFMRLDFGLKNTELMVYAVIFAMHRNYCECFTGTREYLEKWSGGSRSGVERALASLEKRELILKEYRKYGMVKKAVFYINADKLPTCETFSLENRNRDNREKIRRAEAPSKKENT